MEDEDTATDEKVKDNQLTFKKDLEMIMVPNSCFSVIEIKDKKQYEVKPDASIDISDRNSSKHIINGEWIEMVYSMESHSKPKFMGKS